MPSASFATSNGVTLPAPDSSASESQPQPQPQALQFSCGSFVLPHPEKMAKGGEDWFFIAASKRAIGVADGVGGWAEVGVDAGAYARLLMKCAREAAEQRPGASSSSNSSSSSSAGTSSSSSSSSSNGSSSSRNGATSAVSTQVPAQAQAQAQVQVQAAAGGRGLQLSAQHILEVAHSKTKVMGSSTACIIVLNGSTLQASNLGDSGFMVIRDGDMLMATTQQQHSFNFPYQIGAAEAMGDDPKVAERYEVQLQPGDILVVGTDGLWDNVFHEEMLSVLKYCKSNSMRPTKAAQVLGHYARHRAADTKFASPFAYAAYQAGIKYLGGKMDDITVLIAFVEPEVQQTLAKL